MSAQRRSLAEPVLEESLHERLHLRQRDDVVAKVTWREDAVLAPQTTGRSAVVADGHDGGDVRRVELQAAEHGRHAGAATDAHDSRPTLAHAKLIDAIDQALRTGRKRVRQRPVQPHDAGYAERAAYQEEQASADEQRHELERGDADPIGHDHRSVALRQSEGDAQADANHAYQQHEEPAFDVESGSQQLQHRGDQVITREAMKLTTVTISAPRKADPKSATRTPPP